MGGDGAWTDENPTMLCAGRRPQTSQSDVIQWVIVILLTANAPLEIIYFSKLDNSPGQIQFQACLRGKWRCQKSKQTGSTDEL